jgi:hypothetical protein
MKTTFTLLLTFFYLKASFAQCYGGKDFSTAELFDAGWISQCNTGTSCNTGVTMLSNQSTCEPSTAIDACAPTPSCGTVSNMGSDLWFKFLANSTTATISVTRNSSFTVGIQAFSAPAGNYNPACLQLTQIGCVASGSPSGNTQLVLTSLTPGNLYFFRVYGVDPSPSQRAGHFCFCGSTGLTETSLPVKLISFAVSSSGKGTVLNWIADQQPDFSYYEVEKSTGENKFISLGKQPVIYNGSSRVDYRFEEKSVSSGPAYYRLKMVDINGKYGYSDIIKTSNQTSLSGLRIKQDDANHRIIIYSDTATEVEVYTLTGDKLTTYHLAKGDNSFYHDFKPGVYIIRKKGAGEAQKLVFYP